LSVADLVYLIRIVVGDALAYPKLTSVPASYTFNDGILSVDTRMGAALAVFAGDITPTLLASNMEIRHHFDGTETRVLVSKIEVGASFEDAFLQADGELLSVEMATYDGTPVVFKTLPAQFGLFQNYPNPFNPKTTIAFAVPSGGDYRLTVFNVTGQEVASFTGVAEVGQIETVEFDATDVASGVYFYKLETDGFSQSRKMVLMK
ncbi:MAG: T9SS type A sorting domain-containing protein, partial [candidate division Zixibacteria bacterium]|nr:T9SS type A sorting domain-containing protein [candidate division Zixibacteria bacterium]